MSVAISSAELNSFSNTTHRSENGTERPKFRALQLWKDLEQHLFTVMIPRNMRFGRRFYKHCVRGSDVVTIVLEFLHQQPEDRFRTAKRSNVAALCGKLISDGFLAPVRNASSKSNREDIVVLIDSDKSIYRMLQTSLTGEKIGKENVDLRSKEDPNKVISREGSASSNNVCKRFKLDSPCSPSKTITPPQSPSRRNMSKRQKARAQQQHSENDPEVELQEHHHSNKTKWFGISSGLNLTKPLLGISFPIHKARTQDNKRMERLKRRKRSTAIGLLTPNNIKRAPVTTLSIPTTIQDLSVHKSKYFAPPPREFPEFRAQLKTEDDTSIMREAGRTNHLSFVPLRNNFMGPSVMIPSTRGSTRRQQVSLLKQVEEYITKKLTLDAYASINGRTVGSLLSEPIFNSGMELSQKGSLMLRNETDEGELTELKKNRVSVWRNIILADWILSELDSCRYKPLEYFKDATFHSVTVFTPSFEKIIFRTEQECTEALRKFLLRLKRPLIPPCLLHIAVDAGISTRKSKTLTPLLMNYFFTLLPRINADILRVLCHHWHIISQHRGSKYSSKRLAQDISELLVRKISKDQQEAISLFLQALIDNPDMLKVNPDIASQAASTCSKLQLSMGWERHWPRISVLPEPIPSTTHDFLIQLLQLHDDNDFSNHPRENGDFVKPMSCKQTETDVDHVSTCANGKLNTHCEHASTQSEANQVEVIGQKTSENCKNIPGVNGSDSTAAIPGMITQSNHTCKQMAPRTTRIIV